MLPNGGYHFFVKVDVKHMSNDNIQALFYINLQGFTVILET
jgi:hypothetical protein